MISKKQKAVLDYIGKFISEKGYSPSYSEIGEGMGISSKSTIFKYIKSLKERGFVSDIAGKKRSLFLTDVLRETMAENRKVEYGKVAADGDNSHIPLLGYIAAGYPVEAVQIEETIAISEDFRAGKKEGDIFALKVRGDSMIEDMIKNGDVIILKKTAEVSNGKIVAAIIDGYEATLKRYYRVGERQVKLMPSNPLFEPIILDAARVKIIGELTGLIRKY